MLYKVAFSSGDKTLRCDRLNLDDVEPSVLFEKDLNTLFVSYFDTFSEPLPDKSRF